MIRLRKLYERKSDRFFLIGDSRSGRCRIGFFLKRGFEKISAINTASVLLQQADIDEVPVFQLLDTINGISDVQLNNVIAQILNMNRTKTSKLGYKPPQTFELFDQRNIIV